MKKRVFWFLLPVITIVLGAFIYGCTEKEEEEDLKGTIYGTVTDFTTGEPVSNANVSLRPGGETILTGYETTLTGYDGMFEFYDVEEGDYSIKVSKDGYSDLVDNYIIRVTDGKRMQRDVQIQRMFESFSVLLNGQEVNTIDFGISLNNIQITLYNNGSTTIDRISYSTSEEWFGYHIYSVSNLTNIEPNTSRVMNIELYRNKLYSGENVGYLYLSSGDVSKTIVVKAVKN